MRHPFSPYAIPAAAMLLLTGCLDDKYDLSNIDSTTELKVKDLVVPINFENLTLNEVTDLSDNEFITLVKVADGKEYYAFSRTESFRSGEIQIPYFYISAPYIPSVDVYVKQAVSQAPQKRAIALEPISALKEISQSGNLPEGVVEIEHLGTESCVLGIYIRTSDATINCSNLRLQFPPGLDVYETSGGKYDPATGVLEVGETTIYYNSTRFYVRFNGLGKKSISCADGKYNFNGKLGILSTGNVLYNGDLTYANPYVNVSFDVNSIYPEVITASIDHEIKNISFDSVNLNGLPDFLAGSGTSINAANPQIYVGIDNNVGQFSGDTYLGFTSVFRRDNGETYITTGTTSQKVAVSKNLRTNIFLASNAQAVPSLAQYLDPAPASYSFPSLTNVLYAGQADWGLPKEIYIDATDVNVVGTKVENLPLGEYQPGFTGTYTVFVPLAFEKGSLVQYTTKDTGWSSDDISDLRVNKMHFSAIASTDIPFDLDFSIVPIDEAGNPIPVQKSTHILLPANANLQQISLEIEALPGQPIEGLDGISYTAIVKVDEAGNNMPLTPEMAIGLSNVRLTVDGAWIHKF